MRRLWWRNSKASTQQRACNCLHFLSKSTHTLSFLTAALNDHFYGIQAYLVCSSNSTVPCWLQTKTAKGSFVKMCFTHIFQLTVHGHAMQKKQAQQTYWKCNKWFSLKNEWHFCLTWLYCIFPFVCVRCKRRRYKWLKEMFLSYWIFRFLAWGGASCRNSREIVIYSKEGFYQPTNCLQETAAREELAAVCDFGF